MQRNMGSDSSQKLVCLRIVDTAARSTKTFTCDGCKKIKTGDNFREVCRINLSEQSYRLGKATIALHNICDQCYPLMLRWCSEHHLYSNELIKYCDSTITRLASNRFKARRNGIIFGISSIDLVYLYLQQNGVCYFSGIPMDFRAKGRGGGFSKLSLAPNAPSLIRIDPEGAFLVDNLRWGIAGIAHMRDGLSNEQFIDFCQKVTEVELARKVLGG